MFDTPPTEEEKRIDKFVRTAQVGTPDRLAPEDRAALLEAGLGRALTEVEQRWLHRFNDADLVRIAFHDGGVR